MTAGMDGGTLALFNPFRSGSSGSSSITSKKINRKLASALQHALRGLWYNHLEVRANQKIVLTAMDVDRKLSENRNYCSFKKKVSAEFIMTVNQVIG
jgi:hypothetical protein